MMKRKFNGRCQLFHSTCGRGLLFAAFIFSALLSHAEARTLKAVDPGLVCMVNDAVMDKPQIPVPFDGKTYYGCCQGCVGRLQNDRAMRFTKDPLTGREVDKAEAFIMAGPGGMALYFESAETAQKYNATTATKKPK